jgi:endonuclease/exonuclease/phosphatase family metal-dependent hydrolase
MICKWFEQINNSIPIRLCPMLLLIFTINSCFAQSASIEIDGVFNDWHETLTTERDPSESISGIDLLSLSLTNDRDYLFIRLKADKEFDFSDNIIDHNIHIYLDTDNDASTGDSKFTEFGADLVLNLKDRRVNFYNPNLNSISLNDIHLRVAPTVTSNSFEIAIPRNVMPDGQNRLFKASNLKLIVANLSNNDRIPNSGNLLYDFDESRLNGYDLVDINKRSDDLIRIVAYNTLSNGLTDLMRKSHFEKIIKAIKPDIIGFSECWNTEANYVKSIMDQWLPLNTNNGWYVEKQIDRGLITASKWEILDRWEELPNQFPVLINLPDKYSSDILFTNAHLNCCGNESGRQDQVDAYSRFINDAKTKGGEIDLSRNTPFVYAGDLNLVGYSQQLTTLISGDIQNTIDYGLPSYPDWDNSEVSDLISLHSDSRFSFTWKNENGSYPPGKLDYILYSDAVVSVEKSFVLRTEEMNVSRLGKYGLDINNTESASDHFPVIADFEVTKSLNKVNSIFPTSIQLIPNPAKNQIKISSNTKMNTYQIFNVLGKKVLSGVLTNPTIQIESLYTGSYFIVLKETNTNKTYRKKFIK